MTFLWLMSWSKKPRSRGFPYNNKEDVQAKLKEPSRIWSVWRNQTTFRVFAGDNARITCLLGRIPVEIIEN